MRKTEREKKWREVYPPMTAQGDGMVAVAQRFRVDGRPGLAQGLGSWWWRRRRDGMGDELFNRALSQRERETKREGGRKREEEKRRERVVSHGFERPYKKTSLELCALSWSLTARYK